SAKPAMAPAPITTSKLMNWILPLRRAADWPRVVSLSRADLSCSNDADSVALPAMMAASTESGIVIDSDLKLRCGKLSRCVPRSQVRRQEIAMLVTGAGTAAGNRDAGHRRGCRRGATRALSVAGAGLEPAL